MRLTRPDGISQSFGPDDTVLVSTGRLALGNQVGQFARLPASISRLPYGSPRPTTALRPKRPWGGLCPSHAVDFMLLSRVAKHEPNLSLVFQALSDPTRRAMLARLGQGAAPVTELARPSGMALPTILRHLQVLEDADLIVTEKTGRTRMCSARPDTFAATLDWMAEQRTLWEARTDRLEALLQTLAMKDN